MAPAEESMNEWRLLRWILVALWLSTTLYVSIPDFPRDTPLWETLTWDRSGWLHEVFYIAVGFLVLIDLTYRWQKPRVIVLRKRIEKV